MSDRQDPQRRRRRSPRDGKGSSRRSSLPACRRGVEGVLLTVSAVMRVERMGPVAARHSPPGPAELDIRLYTLSPSHSADDVVLPPADDADDDVTRRECQTRPQWGRACFADALLPAAALPRQPPASPVTGDDAFTKR